MPRALTSRGADKYTGVSDADDDYVPGKKRAAPKKRLVAASRPRTTSKSKKVKFDSSDYADDYEDDTRDKDDFDEDHTPAPVDAAEANMTSAARPDVHEYSPAPVSLRGGGKTRRANDRPRATKARDNPDIKSSGRTNKSVGKRSTRSSRTSPILVDLERLAKEDAAVKSEIARLGLMLRDVEGDGNCLFRALSDQMYGDQKRHPELRKLTCDYLEANKADFEMWVKWGVAHDGESYEAYVNRMRKSGQYASEVEVHACARLLKRNIRIVHSDHSSTIPFAVDAQPGSASADRVEEAESRTPHHDVSDPISGRPAPATPRRRNTRSRTSDLLSTPSAPPPSSPLYASALAEYLPPTRPGRTMLWLALFNDAEHYQSVRRKGDHERGPAEIEDRLLIPHERDMSESAKAIRSGSGSETSSNSTGSSEINSSPQSHKRHTTLDEVLRSLPAGHGFNNKYILGIIKRFKGDVAEAIESLLEELELLALAGNDEDDNDSTGDCPSEAKRIDEMLCATSLVSDPSTPEREMPLLAAHIDQPSSPLSVLITPRQASPTQSTVSATSDRSARLPSTSPTTPTSEYTPPSTDSTPTKPRKPSHTQGR